jgi:lipid-A-disaccharide synthase
MARHIYISTGEASGAEHAARLVRACRELAGEADALRVTGMGGAALREAGVEAVADLSGRGIMGFTEVLGHLPAIRRALRTVTAHLAEDPPDAVVLVDYPGFHLRLARWIRRNLPGRPVLYYIAPKAWAWKENRVRTLRATVDRLLVIFPFEEAWFAERGVPAVYVGNPTADAVEDVPARDAARRALGLPPRAPVLAMLPGSRPGEVARMLPVFLEAARRLRRRHPDLVPALALAPGLRAEDPPFRDHRTDDVRVVSGESRLLMRAADAVLAKSGTTTLEAALLGTPTVVAYRTGRISARIARAVVRLPDFSLPNILSGTRIVPEYIQEAATPEALAEGLGSLLAPDSPDAAAMRAAFDALRRELGSGSAGRRAAREVLAAAEGMPERPTGNGNAHRARR